MTYDEHQLAGAFAVDVLDAVERTAFERHQDTCAPCADEVAEHHEVLARLSSTAVVEPPAELKATLMARIAELAPPIATSEQDEATAAPSPDPATVTVTVTPIRRRPSHVVQWLAAAAAVVAIAVTGLVWRPWASPTPPLSATDRVVQATDATRYEQTVGGATVTLVRSPSLHEAVLIIKNMPAAPEGKTYQLWYQTPTADMVDAGLMPESAGPNAAVLLHGDAAFATGAGVTLEPKGGSPAPTTDPIVVIPFT